MSDQPEGVSFQGPQAAGQQPATTPEPASPPVQGQGNETPAAYITREEALQLAKQAATEAVSKAQSLWDKGISKQVREQIASLEKAWKLQEKAGVPVSDEEKDKVRLRIMSQTDPETGAPGSPASSTAEPAQAQPDGDQAPDPVTEEAWRMMEAAGVVIEDGDPEAGTLDQSSAYKFLQSIERAIQAKQARLNVSKTPTTLGGQGGIKPLNPIETITDPTELLKMALGKVK